MTKRTLSEQKEEISLYSLLDCETFDGAIERLKEQKAYFEERYPDATKMYLDIQHCGYDGGIECHLMIERLETDAEYHKRTEHEKKTREAAQARARRREADALKILQASEKLEREMYEKLHAKYGKTNQ